MNIVLVHGILGFRQRLGVEYFAGVAEHFREKGMRVLAPQLDPTRGIEFRANQLREQVTAGLASGALDPHEATHLIAHSMGGLDSRCLLSPANPNRLEARVRSLTTISTPHRGSPIADLLDAPERLFPFPHLPFGPAQSPLEAALNVLGISLDGLRDLTSEHCRTVVSQYVDDPGVAYFSVAGGGRNGFPPTAAPLLLFHSYIVALTGQANDGLVAIDSARYGTFDPQLWPADHADEIGHNLDNLLLPPAFPYLAKYDQLVENIKSL